MTLSTGARWVPWRRSGELACLRQEVAELAAELRWLRETSPAAATTKAAEANPHVTLGQDCRIAPGVQLMAQPDRPISIGDRAVIYRGAEIAGPVSIGARSFVNRDAYIRSGTTIGCDVAIGPFVRFVTDTHEPGTPSRRAGRNAWPPITVGDGTWIGAGAIILGGVTIGAGCVIAAGAVVTRDVPAHTLSGGVPARVIRDLDQ